MTSYPQPCDALSVAVAGVHGALIPVPTGGYPHGEIELEWVVGRVEWGVIAWGIMRACSWPLAVDARQRVLL